ncbi:septum formation initiator family protein [Streptomyces sp. NPDC048595]|uniref:FtsB family cell division protein n=1 Tax=Streptomyces sp. NPDC048595 TaxID=3365576 RepID=UPI0037183AA5
MRGQGRPRRQKRLSALFPSSAAARGTAARTPFVLLIVVLLGSGLITLLLLNSALNQGSFALDKLERETGELTDEQQALQQEVDASSAPDALERRARELGMVPGGSPVFLLPDGRVLGRPHTATSQGAPLSTSAKPSAAALLGAAALTPRSGPSAPSAPSALFVPPAPPVAPPSVEPPVPVGSVTLAPEGTPRPAGPHGTPAASASAAPQAPRAAPASPATATPHVPFASTAPTAPAWGAAPAPSPTTFGR